MDRTFKSTRIACYIGYFIQAIVNNLSPVLFIIYQEEFSITYSHISSLIIFNFVTQLIVDISCVKFVEKYGKRLSIVLAHGASYIGLMMLGILPRLLPFKFFSLALSTVFCAIGSGMIEVLISPIVSDLPSDNKTGDMSFLHSFYCWGQLIVVLLTTILLAMNTVWWLLPILWSVIPFINLFNFLTVPIVQHKDIAKKVTVKELFKNNLFICFLLLMICAGSSEMAMSQWASLFVEKTLKINKALGDLLGPCMFALFMGIGRIIFGVFGGKLNIYKVLIMCSFSCFAAYIIAALSNSPLLSLFACALCGFSVSVMWPGIFTASAKRFKTGSTSMFAILAFGGDLGCSCSPALAGFMSDFAEKSVFIKLNGLRFGLLGSCIFPLMMFVLLIFTIRKKSD